MAALPSMAARRSARATDRLAVPNAPSRARSSLSPRRLPTRCGRTIGRTRNWRSSRANRGSRPARRNDDLPAPDAPRMTSNRGGGASCRSRSRSSASMTGASRPKKMPASSASSGNSPRYGVRAGSFAGGQGKYLGSRPDWTSPMRNRSSPSVPNATSAVLPPGSVTVA